MRIIELGFDRRLVSRLYDNFGESKLLFGKQLKGSAMKKGNFRLLGFFFLKIRERTADFVKSQPCILLKQVS